MTDKTDLIREIHEYVTTHGGENTATHLLVQAASAIQTQAAELEAVGAGGVQSLSPQNPIGTSAEQAPAAINSGAKEGAVYAELPEPTTHQIAELKACEHGDAIVGWRVEPSRQSFHASMHPKRTLYTTEQARNFADRTHALRVAAAPQAAPAVEPSGYDTMQLYKDLQDLWSEANAVDTIIGRPDVLLRKITKMRDAVGKTVATYLPIAAAPQAAPAQDKCAHRIADARNSVVQSGYLCIDCGEVFKAASHTTPQTCFDAADMATASAQGFRDGVASLSANAGEPTEDVKQKIASNTWDHFGDILPTLKAISRGEWYWGANSRCKYIEIRLDTRDGGCLLFDQDRVRISPEQFAHQHHRVKMEPWPAQNSLAAAPQPAAPAGWRELAARVMDALADAQDKTNSEYPEHVKCYPSWASHARWLRWHADMFRTGKPVGNGAGQPGVLAALAASPTPPAEQQAAPKAAPGEPDPADIIAGALQISRGHAIEMMREACLGAAPQQEAQEPALFVSAKQLAALTDPDDPDGEHGRYLPVRKTTKGLFTQALYTAPQPAPAPLSDDFVKDAARWRWLSEHIGVAWNEGKFTSLVRIVSDKNRTALNASIDQMMAGDWSDAALAAQGGKA